MPPTRFAELRRPGKQATVCLDGYLSKDFDEVEEDDEVCYGRAAVQHLALFVPWEKFLCEEAGDINDVWMRARGALSPRISCLVENVQLLRRSAEDAKRDVKQWAASAGDGDAMVVHMEEGEAGETTGEAYEPSKIGDATRFMDVVRNALGPGQVTAGSAELTAMTRQLCLFQQSALSSTAELEATVVSERGARQIELPGHAFSGGTVPSQGQVKAIKSQQMSASKERERMIQGIQRVPAVAENDRRAALRAVMSGFGEDDMEVSAAELDEVQGQELQGHADAEMQVQLGRSTFFLAAGKEWARRLTLNERQSIAFLILCRQLDLIRAGKTVDADQLCQFVGGEFARDRSIGVLVRREGHIKPPSHHGHVWDGRGEDQRHHDTLRLRVHQRPREPERKLEKDVLVIDEVSMLGARTLHAVNEQLCRLRGSQRDFRGIPIVLFCGDFHQFRPVQERSIVLPSTAISWDVDNSFKAEQRHQHDKAHALWRRFTTNLNIEASVAFQVQQRSIMRIFVSEHNAIPVPAVFMFVPGMPVVVNQNTYQGLKVTNGGGYTAAKVIVDKPFPGHRVSAGIMIHFGPPAGLILASETTKDLQFVGMPPGTILLTPISVKILRQRKRP
ncbi:hypothetical protein HIM_06047 [Hirsutella minnesotensis 3608]|uniref:ATP-dependent DNA helicase n=1 Tax=Hirsutella minnesotensis 3608 TaxID=1043627 RepID=A0A0F7ZJI7_9HYPO|nr:hypothetical protein HIM_06047 [Hirsutella minnesotensis 3608]